MLLNTNKGNENKIKMMTANQNIKAATYGFQ